MNLQSQTVLTNLRMLRGLNCNQWLITKRRIDGKLEIEDVCDDTYYNNFILAIKQDLWESTKECLKTLYCEDLPRLVIDLVHNKEHKDLSNLNKLLEGSLNGLDALNKTYNYGSVTILLNSLRFDYGAAISEKIIEYLDSVNYNPEE